MTLDRFPSLLHLLGMHTIFERFRPNRSTRNRSLLSFLLLCAVGLLPVLTGCSALKARFSPVPEPEHAIRAVTWNIQWFPGRAPGAPPDVQMMHRHEVRAYLPDLRPDILLLQEIRDAEAAQFLVDSVPGLELHVVTAFTRGDTDLSQQLVIASRYPARAGFAEVFTGIYSEPDVAPYRGFAFAALESPLGGTLLVYSVHLKSNRGEAADNIRVREASAQQILNHISVMKEQYAEYGPVAVIVGGDFNLLLERKDMAHERTLAKFTEAGFHWTWEDVSFRRRVTWPSDGRYEDACFDHFLTWGLPSLRAKVFWKPEGELSDHRPVLLSIPLASDE